MYIDKDEVFKQLNKREDKMFMSKVLDQALLSFKYHEVRFTDFLDPYRRQLVKRTLQGYLEGDMHCFGGYQESERSIITFSPEYIDIQDIIYPITVLEVHCHNISKLSHRDFLGAILNLGIKREKIGDILINEQNCLLFCMADIKDFILYNLEKVANQNVSIKGKTLTEITLPEKKFKLMQVTVPSMRLDALLSSAIGESRSKALTYISAEKVHINWEPAKSCSQQLQLGDTLSIKGKGRIIIDEVGNVTRKGRIHVTMKKLI